MRGTPVPELAPVCENEGCRVRFEEHGRRLGELEVALRAPEHGIFDTLKRLELQFVQFTTTVTQSVKTTVAIGSAAGALLGALAAAAAVAAFLGHR
jgi:hypothetical protein